MKIVQQEESFLSVFSTEGLKAKQGNRRWPICLKREPYQIYQLLHMLTWVTLGQKTQKEEEV